MRKGCTPSGQHSQTISGDGPGKTSILTGLPFLSARHFSLLLFTFQIHSQSYLKKLISKLVGAGKLDNQAQRKLYYIKAPNSLSKCLRNKAATQVLKQDCETPVLRVQKAYLVSDSQFTFEGTELQDNQPVGVVMLQLNMQSPSL